MGLIRTTYEIITEESAQDGEVEESGFSDELGTEYSLNEAIGMVMGSEPSSSEFHRGVWYTHYGEMDSITGETENESYHLHGFTEEEERVIFESVRR